jgi:hypothetical protein
VQLVGAHGLAFELKVVEQQLARRGGARLGRKRERDRVGILTDQGRLRRPRPKRMPGVLQERPGR